jgi:hypothetical protein
VSISELDLLVQVNVTVRLRLMPRSLPINVGSQCDGRGFKLTTFKLMVHKFDEETGIEL